MKPIRNHSSASAEIDITPFTDVILVLLIIFMLSAPFLVRSEYEKQAGSTEKKPSGFQIDLPKAQAKQLELASAPVVVALLGDGRTVLENKAIEESELQTKLSGMAQKNPDTEVIVQADRMVPNYRVVHIMDLAYRAGLKRLSIATKSE